ncbi:MAG: M12 family metallopeptidase [Granulosicoccus sp.]
MSCSSIADVGRQSKLVRLSCLVLISLASCVRADPPEMFVADPSIQNDYLNRLPDNGFSHGFSYEIIQGHAVLEGDILLGPVDENGQIPTRPRARGIGKSDSFGRWPDGIVVYERPDGSSKIQQDNVAAAIAHWNEKTTLSFVERTEENASQYPHYIQFQSTQSCASHVGMIGGPQPIYISDACSTGSIIHEIGHAVGLFHEHTRVDRDNFVQIDWNEVVEGKDINFNIQSANVATYSDYDYGSIMHYGEVFFSKSGLPTIIVADGIKIGQREALSPLDIESANAMYETDLALGPPISTTTDDDLEIDVTTYNMGNLGAHQLQLVVQLKNDSVWKGVSNNSDWNCLALGAELSCTRDTMREQSESRFTILADPGTATSEDLSIRLISRTQDSDLSNNALNDTDTNWQTIGVDLAAASSDEPDRTGAVNLLSENADSASTPAISAAKLATGPETVDTVNAAAGGMNIMVLAGMAITLAIRRRRITRLNLWKS